VTLQTAASSTRSFRGARIRAGELIRLAGARGVIFDMDGVLSDTQEFHLESWRLLLERRFAFTPPAGLIRSSFGQSNEKIIPLLFPQATFTPKELAELGEEKEALYREVARSRVRPLAGVEEFLSYLAEAGIPAAVGTSGPPENVRLILEEFRWEGRFQAVVDRDQFPASKPAPDCFLAAAARLGVPPHRTVVFEDSFHGLAAARRAGAVPVGIATTFPEVELILRARWAFRDFTEIVCG
jgi:HAD superfamily hydrolase (TIGR01509 family)